MIIVPANADSEQGRPGTTQQFADMRAYNDQMLRAGVFVDGQGLHPTSRGARVTWVDGDWSVTDGPFAEAKELIAGFTIIEVSSREEALEWLKKWPASCAPDPGQHLELRQVYAPEDFGEEFTAELREREEQMREEAARNAARG
ncbi:YciI family protein [Intrasporangium sp. YIM S08009]|uniref:YciI family protein n=1 Tax=Intrasporangium zincisolvens TaxID=3080018 RepID=UPI002B06104E|nr:YciI family protein [Intrasporangium sp. YIM S08009]